MGFDARGDAQDDRSGRALASRCDFGDQIEFIEAVHDDATDANVKRVVNLRGQLVVAVEHDAVGGHAAGQGYANLAA